MPYDFVGCEGDAIPLRMRTTLMNRAPVNRPRTNLHSSTRSRTVRSPCSRTLPLTVLLLAVLVPAVVVLEMAGPLLARFAFVHAGESAAPA